MIFSQKTIVILLGLTIIGCSEKKQNTTETNTKTEQISSDEKKNTSNDWEGTYTATLPCADCEGIETKLTLYKDLKYSKTSQYLGKKDAVFTEKGTFSLDKENNKISTISDDKIDQQQYKIEDRTLTMLDMDGKVTQGALSKMYIFKKL